MGTISDKKSKGKVGELEIYKSGILTYARKSNAKWDVEIGDVLVELVSRAMSHEQICKVVGITTRTLSEWLNSEGKYYKKEFAKEFAVAYKFSADIFESRSLKIANDSTGDIIRGEDRNGRVIEKANMASTNRAKLKIDQNNRMAAVRNRDKHGKVETQKHEGSIETSFVITHYGGGNGDNTKQIPADIGKNRLG